MPRKLELEVEVLKSGTGALDAVREIESLEDRVVALTKDTVALRKEKESTTAQIRLYNDAIKAGRTFTAEEARELEKLIVREKELTAAVSQKTGVQRTARQELRNLQFASNDARQEAALLAAQFGVALPRGFDQLITRIPRVQSLISGAFNVALVASFGAVIVNQIIPALVDLHKWLTDIDEVSKGVFARLAGENLQFGSENEAGVRALIQQRRDRITALEALAQRELVLADPATGLPVDAGLRGSTEEERKEIEKLTTEIDGLVKKLGELAEARKKLKDPNVFEIAVVPGGLPPGAEFGGVSQVGPPSLHERGVFVTTPVTPGVISRDPTLLTPEEREAQAQFERDKEEARRDDLYQRSLERAREFNEERLRLATEAAEEQRRLIEQEGRDWEFLFDRITGGAKSAGDIVKNIWRELAQEAKRQFFQGLAALSHGQSPGGAATGQPGRAGGVFGGILGSVFGGGVFGGGATVGGTPPFVASSGFLAGTNAPGSIAGFGGANQRGVFDIPGATPVGPQPTTAATLGLPSTIPIGDILGNLGRSSAPLLAAGGLAALGGVGGGLIRGRGPLVGAGIGAGIGIGGLALAGGLLGAAHGAGFGVGALIGLGSLGGPVGLAIAGSAAAIGLLIGMSGHGADKRHDAAIANAGFVELRGILEDYYRFRRDYGSSVDAAQDVWSQMTGQFVRRQSAASQRPYFDQVLEAMRSTEDERRRRRGLLGLQALPEFEEGGFVGGARARGSSGIPALLHAGEFVMTSAAVQRLGVSLLENLNQGGPSSMARASDDGPFKLVRVDAQEWDDAVEDSFPRIIAKGGSLSRKLRRRR